MLRAGLEELLAGENLARRRGRRSPALVHQTFRLASVIEDLLLLSRMDAGRLQIQFSRLDLSLLFERLRDDLGTLPDPLSALRWIRTFRPRSGSITSTASYALVLCPSTKRQMPKGFLSSTSDGKISGGAS